MAQMPVHQLGIQDRAELLSARVRTQGSGAHPHRRLLLEPSALAADLADAAHHLCAVHGRHPGLIELAEPSARPVAPEWFAQAIEGFARERATLVALVAAAGPLPSTPGQAETEATIALQRHAIETLAQSARTGCAIGAAAALLLDWIAIRDVLDRLSERLGLPVVGPALPDTDVTDALVRSLATAPAMDRAIGFGTEQLLAQHRGLWDILAARAAARR